MSIENGKLEKFILFMYTKMYYNNKQGVFTFQARFWNRYVPSFKITRLFYALRSILIMNIYLWITVIASITFILVIFLFVRKFLAGKENGILIFSVIFAGVLVSALLYILSSMKGTQILAADFATEYQIKEETFKTTDENTAHYLNAAYAFYAENGVQYQLRGTDLLKEPETDPAFIGIYTCEAVDGYSWCYLKKGTVIRHTLTKRSHEGKEAIDYEHRKD